MSAPARPALDFAGPHLRDPALEEAYRRDARREELQVNLVVYLVAAANAILLVGSDRFFVPPGPARWALLAARVLYVALVAAGLWAARRAARPATRDRLHTGLSVCMMALTVAIYSTRPRDYFLYLPYDVVVAFATWAVLAVPFALQAALSALALISAVVVLAMFREPMPPAGRLVVASSFLTVHVLGALTSWHLHRVRRRAWLRGREAALAWRAAEEASRGKSVFLASVSHELLSPLAGLVASADGLVRRGQAGAGDEALAGLRDEAAALHGLLADVVDLARGEAVALSAEPVPTSVGSLLADVQQSLASRAAAGAVALQRQVEPGVPAWLRLDGRRLRQILLNLAANALRVTERGEVVLTASAGPVAGGRVALRLEVRDTGPGLTADQLAHAFEPFWQGPGQPPGRRGAGGLGLAVAQKLAHQLGGRVEVRSRVGEGSTFALVVEGVEVLEGQASQEGAADALVACADPGLLEEAAALADVPHVARAMALAERAEALAAAGGDPALARWASGVRALAEALDAAGLSAALRRLMRPEQGP